MRHIPVLLNETTDALQLKPGDNVIDCTLGDGGHAEAMLEKISPKGRLLGIDADPESLLSAKQYLYRFGERVTFVRENFAHLEKIVSETNFGPVNGILLDLGWSSPQFEERGRGFSFEKDEPLDMKYDRTPPSIPPLLGEGQGEGLTAANVVNTYDFDDLYRIFRMYGEEDLSREIAEEIIAIRNQAPTASRGAATAAKSKNQIETTEELVDIILRVYRQKLGSDKEVPWIGGLHPATKVFQALRIEVNHELEVLRQALPQAVACLSPQGRLAIITFHSLEDRIVKHYFQSIESPAIRVVTKKPIIASETELDANPRARSAKLRVIEKVH